MTSGFFTGLVLGLALWAVVIWWHRSRLAKADRVWLDVIRSYPRSAAATSPVGYGNWSSGAAWLCSESSDNLARAFGSTTLTAKPKKKRGKRRK